ncbi:MAG TPA: NUDIX hydrolase [Spirochaetota bacterium]|nr:NUDIX hydrolase [Spirochaetota bacterium]HPI90780.1 NUDIX hydrolase [Spirochaetota bacterium]HPR47499.1 NUDIX hydrolase [Spirochaetota bacterium]
MSTTYRNPVPTVDIIIEMGDADRGGQNTRSIVLISRKNPPLGWALPGGFVDYGESLEQAARREALEETSLEVGLVRQFHSYSDPQRDPRQHTITTVFIARATGVPQAADDAREARLFTVETLPENIVFDHRTIIMDYYNSKY